MAADETHKPVNDDQIFDRQAFEKVAIGVLSELRDVVQRNLDSHDLYELQGMSIWERRLPSFQDDALSVLFERFPSLGDAFNFRQTAAKLCTLENLGRLIEDQGAHSVNQTFQEFFEIHAAQQWSVLIPVENVVIREHLPAISGQSVCMRPLTEEEKIQLAALHVPQDRLKAWCFVTEQQAGDPQTAVARARESIEEFIAPYYLHRILSPDRWWRARTMRQIVSPLAFYSGPEVLLSISHDLRQLPTEATDLFVPDPDMDPKWKTDVESLARTWREPRTDWSELERCLQLCGHWMLSAELEESNENAFLKHAVAWEGLFPQKADRIHRCWYLLLLCLGASDALCIKTVSQASRLVDRRNSLAHPEIARTLYGTTERDLDTLKQSLRWGFDNAILMWQHQEMMEDSTCDWSELLTLSYKTAASEASLEEYDDTVFQLFNDLGLVEEDPEHEEATAVLSRDGRSLRIEAHIARARELWGKNQDPKESVCLLARALQIADEACLPLYRYHVLLTLKERHESMNSIAFEEGWNLGHAGSAPPTADEITHMLEEMKRDFGMRPELVGWKIQ